MRDRLGFALTLDQASNSSEAMEGMDPPVLAGTTGEREDRVRVRELGRDGRHHWSRVRSA